MIVWAISIFLIYHSIWIFFYKFIITELDALCLLSNHMHAWFQKEKSFINCWTIMLNLFQPSAIELVICHMDSISTPPTLITIMLNLTFMDVNSIYLFIWGIWKSIILFCIPCLICFCEDQVSMSICLFMHKSYLVLSLPPTHFS